MIYVNFQNELFIIVPKIDEKVYFQNLSYHFYGSAMNHLELGIWVGWWVSKQISKKTLVGQLVQTMKRGQHRGYSWDNCTVKCTVHIYTQLPPRRLLGLFVLISTQIAWNVSLIRSKELSTNKYFSGRSIFLLTAWRYVFLCIVSIVRWVGEWIIMLTHICRYFL